MKVSPGAIVKLNGYAGIFRVIEKDRQCRYPDVWVCELVQITNWRYDEHGYYERAAHYSHDNSTSIHVYHMVVLEAGVEEEPINYIILEE